MQIVTDCHAAAFEAGVRLGDANLFEDTIHDGLSHIEAEVQALSTHTLKRSSAHSKIQTSPIPIIFHVNTNCPLSNRLRYQNLMSSRFLSNS